MLTLWFLAQHWEYAFTYRQYFFDVVRNNTLNKKCLLQFIKKKFMKKFKNVYEKHMFRESTLNFDTNIVCLQNYHNCSSRLFADFIQT